MPWTETCVMEERVKFIMDVSDNTYRMAYAGCLESHPHRGIIKQAMPV